MSNTLRQLKHKNKIYEIGDCLILKESQVKILIGKLLEIVPEGGISGYEEWPSIKVQWYYHWSELELDKLGICEQDTLYLGENELFFSDHVDNVYIDSIIGKCYVFTINDYDNCPTIDDNTYFSRSVFNTREQSLNPPFNEWETFCNCKKPMNPNLLTVGCDK